MKRLLAAALILLFTCAVASAGTFNLKDTTDDLISLLESAAEAAAKGNSTTALDFAEQTELRWNKAEPVLSLFVSHDSLNPIALSVAKLRPYIRNGENADFIAECDACVVQLIHLYRAESFSVEIF